MAVLGIALICAGCANGFREREAFASLVRTERDFARASEAYGMKVAFLRFLHDDSVLFRPHPVNGKQYTSLRPDPGIRLSWEPVRAGVSRSGNLGWTTGPYSVAPSDGVGEPLRGYVVSVWRRQSNGRWKVAVDLGTENPDGARCPEPADLSPPSSSVARDVAATDPAEQAKRLMELERRLSPASGSGDSAAALREAMLPAVRVYRDGHCPALGTAAAFELISLEPGQMTWEPIDAEVAASTDLAFTYGAYRISAPGGGGEPFETGYYVRIWRRADGGWKMALDVTSPVPDEEAASTAD